MTSPVTHVVEELEAKAASFVKEQRLPGAAVGVVHGDELVWSAGIGFADVARRRAPDASTLYRIASITKTFTGTAIMQLRDAGGLHLDDPVVAHIPELRVAESPFGAIETVTVRRLLSHESGLMGEAPGADWTAPSYEGVAARNLERAAEIGVRMPPNTQQKYSNLGYQMLGEVIARVSGIPYVGYVRSSILEPLGMSGTFFEPLPPAALERLATGYANRRFSDELDPASVPPPVWAEGGAVSCVEDLATWIAFQLREDDTSPVLARATRREMQTARYLANEEWTQARGITWVTERRGDVRWVQHSGGIHGFVTDVCFDPKERVGAIALVNGGGDAPALAMDLGEIARAAFASAAPAIEPPASMPVAYRSLLGLYTMAEWDELLRVEWRDGRLTLVRSAQPSWRPTLTPTDDPDVFTVDPGVRESGEPAAFHRTPDGRVRTIHVGALSWARLDAVR